MDQRSGEAGPRAGPERRTRCAWCSNALPERSERAIGRPPAYCRRSCRQRAFEARRRSESLGLSEDELVLTRNELDDVRDRLFEIGVAVSDAGQQLDDGLEPAVVLGHLLDAIDAVVGTN